ncbi:MAG: glutamate--tRNA ligase [Candidatus Nanopelagicales bacterium]|nr:glutamate--tRNA ligase [Candidatus Nanopelagicales bacterium]
MSSDIRVRFCPSPTGNPHVGMIRTALFNWAFARHVGGTFVFRIEDTDAARDSQESYQALLDSMRWLGLNWDEGPEVGGQYGPYRQSERHDLYTTVIDSLADSGYTYPCFCTTEELDARREIAMQEKRAPGYDGHCRDLSEAEREVYRQQGRASVIRFRMPGHDFMWDDLIRGEVTFKAEHVPDFVIVRANGDPLYTLVNPVDDALMRITHVLRGEDLLSSTPRQLALFEALVDIGVAQYIPSYGHLPYVMGEGNKKLSKRDPESSLAMYREQGYLPAALLNYLALLGWSMGNDQEFFSLEDMARAFTLERVNPHPARFDLKKCTAINADWIRFIPPAELTDLLLPFLVRSEVLGNQPSQHELEILNKIVPLIQQRLEILSDAPALISFMFVDSVSIDPTLWTQDSAEVLERSIAAIEQVTPWTAEQIQAALRESLVTELGLKPKVAFGPVRTAITGSKVSPPLFESMEILGQQACLGRLRAASESLQG